MAILQNIVLKVKQMGEFSDSDSASASEFDFDTTKSIRPKLKVKGLNEGVSTRSMTRDKSSSTSSEVMSSDEVAVPTSTPMKYKGHRPVLIHDELKVTHNQKDKHYVSDSSLGNILWCRPRMAQRKIWSVTIMHYYKPGPEALLEKLKNIDKTNIDYIIMIIDHSTMSPVHRGVVKYSKRQRVNSVESKWKTIGKLMHCGIERSDETYIQTIQRERDELGLPPYAEQDKQDKTVWEWGTYVPANVLKGLQGDKRKLDRPTALKQLMTTAKKNKADEIYDGPQKTSKKNKGDKLYDRVKKMSNGATVTQMIEEDSSFITDMPLGRMKELSQEISEDEYNEQIKREAQVKMTKLRPWQKDVVDKINDKPNDRKITMIVDKKGAKGKTYITQTLRALDPEKNIIINMASAKDVYCVLSKAKSPKTLHIDLPRSIKDNDIDWTVIEAIKNGQFQSNKYSSRRICWRTKPHVIIYANRHLKYEKLSLDRWEIYVVNKANELVDVTAKNIEPLRQKANKASSDESDSDENL